VSLRITDAAMTSSITSHTARRETGGMWSVSWLPSPSLPLDRNAAITALTLAELVAAGVSNSAHQQWPHVVSFAAELGLTADDAIYLIREKS